MLGSIMSTPRARRAWTPRPRSWSSVQIRPRGSESRSGGQEARSSGAPPSGAPRAILTPARSQDSGRAGIIGQGRAFPEDRPGCDDDLAPRADTRSEERAVDAALRSHLAALTEDAVADARPGLDPHARGKGGVGADVGAGRHAASRPDVERGLQLRAGLDDGRL